MKLEPQQKALGLLRIALGWIFFWPFIDKLFGLGFATQPANAWISGGSPTTGFLSRATEGPFADLFQSIVGQPWVDWLFMIGLLLIGLSLLFGMGVRIAAYSGSVLLILMWMASLPLAQNPFLDQHIIYILALISLSLVDSGAWLGVGSWWKKQKIVKTYPILR